MQHLKQGVSKTGEIIVNSIPQNQLIYGIIGVDYSIARSNNWRRSGIALRTLGSSSEARLRASPIISNLRSTADWTSSFSR